MLYSAKVIPPHGPWDYAIDLKEVAHPPWGPIYALSETELHALREYLQKLIDEGKICYSKYQAGAPILFVLKLHSRGLRLYVDYRGLNKVILMNRYPLPLMQELSDQVHGSKKFTKINLKSPFILLRIKKGDKWKMHSTPDTDTTSIW